MKSNKLVLLSILSILLFSNCKKDAPAGPAGAAGPNGSSGPAGPSLTGDIVGFVKAFDLNELPVTDNSGVIVSIDGTGYTATTGKDGRYVLASVATGTYNISYSKAGFGTTKTISYKFVGGGQDYAGISYMSSIPQHNPTGLAGSTTDTSRIALTATLNGTLAKAGVRIRFFVDTVAGVSSDPQKHYIFSSVFNGPPPPSKSVIWSIYNPELRSYGIRSGQTVYIVAYSDGYGSYTDLKTGNLIYSSLNPLASNTLIIKAP